MMQIPFISIYLFLLLSNPIWSQSRWSSIHTIEQACEVWPERIDSIFSHLELSRKGLARVKQAYESGNLVKACEELLEYYKNSPSVMIIKSDLPDGSDAVLSEGDSLLQDIFTFQRVTGKVPRDETGHLDWAYTGPEDDIEWAWALNRHYPINNLINLYQTNDEERYLRYIDHFIRDWIIQSHPYPGIKSNTAMWRGLEVSFRVKAWAKVFFGYAHNPLISPATRLLILSSLPDHAHYARYFHGSNNWLTMEMSGLATVAAYWPEFKKSGEWLAYSIDQMTASMKEQVYPDGVQTELSSSYHWVALRNFLLFKSIIDHTDYHLPVFYDQTLEKMWNYLAMTIRPNGFGLLNNDSDLDYNRDHILEVARKYEKRDWEYIVTNGQSGTKPENGPSYFFPWAGQLISRSDFGPDSLWSFFDVGPWGSGHQHNDKSHLSVSAYGRDLLVDGGRFAYRGAVAKRFRDYARSSRGHNVLLIDGHGQGPGPRLAEQPVDDRTYKLTKEFDYATASFSNFPEVEGVVKHSRSLYYQRGEFWVVIDQVATDRPRKIKALWHWHPGSEIDGVGDEVFSNNARGNLRIILLGGQSWDVELIKGQDDPVVQGWYSPEYNIYHPNATSVYTSEIDSSATFAWLLYPSEKVDKDIEAKIVVETDTSIIVQVIRHGESEEVIIPLPDDGESLDNAVVDGYRGIWFELNQKYLYGDKYSGGLGTYTAKHRPMAVYAPAVNKTYFVYGGTSDTASRYLLCMVGAYDHHTGKVSRPVVVCDKKGVDDPHDNPAIMIDDDGYIWVFVSGRGRLRPGFKYRSRYPYSIDHFDRISDEEMTYPQIWNTSKGYLHLFTKYTGVRHLYWESSGDGVQWSEDRLLAAIPQLPGENSGHYQISATEKGRVGTFFNRHPRGDVDRRTDLYYLQTDDLGVTWTDVAGNHMEVPLTKRHSSARVKDFYSEGRNIYLKDMGFTERGYPVGLFIRSAGHEPGPVNQPYEWFIVWWDGGEWQMNTVTSSDHNYDMGSLYLGRDKWRIVGPTSSAEDSPQKWGVGGELSVWASVDRGSTWTKAKDLTLHSRYNHGYVRRPMNYKSPFCFFWADGDPHHFSTSGLYFGDFEGNIWKLPEHMEGEWEEPERVK